MYIPFYSRKVAGIQIVDTVIFGEPEGFPIKFKSDQIERLEYQLVKMVAEANIFERFGVHEFAEILYTSVDPAFRSQGLATEIFRRSINHFKASGFSVCMSEFTGPMTRRIGERFGFVEVAKLNFRDFRDAEGNQVLPNANEEEFITVAVLRL